MRNIQVLSRFSALWPLWAALFLAAGWVSASAQQPTAESPLKLNIAQELGLSPLPGLGGSEKHVTLVGSFTVQQGSRRGMLSLAAQIEPGWHIYSLTQQRGGPLPSKIKVAETPQFKLLGPFQADRPPQVKHYEIYRVPVEEHEGTVIWTAPIELAEGMKPEELKVEIRYDGQVCSQTCIPLNDELVTAAFAGYTAAPETPGEYRPGPGEAQLVLSGHIEPAAVAPGGKAKLMITATPNAGWHVYAYSPTDPDAIGANKPTLIHLLPLPGWKRSPVAASPQPKGNYHDQPVTWTIELTAPADSPTGEVVLSGYLGLQTCKDESCLPPQAVQFRASIPVKPAAEAGKIPLEFTAARRASGDAIAPLVSSYKDVAKLAAENPAPTGKVNFTALLPIVGFGLLGGLILNLMPCVLPVIGLKVLSFVQQGGQHRGKIFALNLWFTVGLLSVFVVLATAAVFANLSWGQQFTFTWFKVAMVVIVFAFALSFLGVWEVPIPGFAQSSTSSNLQHQEGPAGAFFKGIFTTLLATPCSGPFLGPVFAYTLAQPPLVTYVIFLSVGVGMASPYLVIGAFPTLVRWLPKPGEWMDTFKQLMGFVLLGTVVYLFSTISGDYFIATLALVIGVWFACWVIGRVPVYEDAGQQLRAWATGCAAAAAVGWAAFTFLGPRQHLYEWQPFTPEAVARLQAEGKTVMVDFTADWCPTCQLNFIWAINTPGVKEIVKRNGVVPLLADWSDHNNTIKRKLEELNVNSIPLLVVYPAGKPGEVLLLPDLLSEKQVISALEKAGPSKTTAAAAAETAMAPAG